MSLDVFSMLGADLAPWLEEQDAEPNEDEGSDAEPNESEDEGSEDEGSEDGDSDESEDGDSEDEGDEDEGDESGDSEDESEDDESGDSEDGDSEGGGSKGGGSEDDESNESEDGANEEGSDESDSTSAGGFGEEDDKNFAQELLEALEEGLDLLSSNEAIDAAIKAEEEEVKHGEALWRPYSTEYDTVAMARANDESRALALRAQRSVKAEVAALRSRLQNKYLQARTPRAVHGVRRGQALSERRLVDSFTELRSGVRPTRPDYIRENRQDVSLAAAVVIDQSGSMTKKLVYGAIQGAIAIAESLDSLGSPCLVCGPRNNGYGYTYQSPTINHTDKTHYSRYENVHVDIFKDWDEKFGIALPRFGSFLSGGGTPLEDGIQYALQSLNGRSERHRIVFAITDGYPNRQDVVRHQIRVAAEAGVTVVGLGIGSDASFVQSLFPTHIYVPKINGLAQKILALLEGIVFPSSARKIETGAKMGK